MLNLPQHKFADIRTFLLCNTHISTQEELTAIALLVYAIYTATNHFRHHPPAPTCNVTDAVAQFVREGAKDHKNSVRVLNNRWSTHAVHTPLDM